MGILRSLGAAALAASLSLGLVAQNGASKSPPAARKLLNEAVAAAKDGHLDSAYLLAKMAADAADGNPEFDSVRETLRQRATLAHLNRAHQLDLARQHAQAAVEFRAAMQIDPANADARSGLAAEFPAALPPPTSTDLRVLSAQPPITINPATSRLAFHLKSDTRQAIAQLATAYGLRAYVADDVVNRPVRLDIADATFAQTMQALLAVADVDWVALDSKTLYFDSSAKMKAIQPVGLRTFYLPWVADGIALNEISAAVKSTLGLPSVATNVDARAISVRATPEQLDATEQLLLQLRHASGDVLLDVRVLEVSRTAAVDLGVGLPNQFTMFSLGPLLAELNASTTLQNNILQLFEQGGLNAILNSGQLSPTALAQAQSTLSPLLQNPFVVFGGGATLMAASVPPFGINVSDTRGNLSSVESALLRAGNGVSADLKVGERYPIINASFSPILLSSAISSVIGNGSYTEPFPSFTYEDLGLEVKITPHLTGGDTMNLQTEITSKALAGTSVNSVPILTNRSLQTTLTVRNGEPILMAGLLDREETATLSGLPGLSTFPVLSRLFSTKNDNDSDEQLMLMITPYIQSQRDVASAPIWLPPNFAPPGPDLPIPQLGPPGLVQPSIAPGAQPGVPVAPAVPGQPTPPPGGRGGGGL